MTFGTGQSPLTTPQPGGGFDFQLRPREGSDGSRRARRRSRLDRHVVSTVVTVVGVTALVLAAAGGGAWYLVNESESQVRADSAAFCADLATTPGVLETPAYGWPTEAATLEEFVAAMRAYSERWTALGVTGPPTIRTDLAAIGTAAGRIADSVESTRTNDRNGNLAKMQSVTSQTKVKSWAAKYCS